MTGLPLTPSQTVGPYLSIGLPWPDGPAVVPEGTPGAITISGRLLDGEGAPIPDGLIETWQADPVLSAITDPARRDTLIATADPGDETRFLFTVRLQGDGETVFFDV